MDRATSRDVAPQSSEESASRNTKKQLTHVVEVGLWKNAISKARLIPDADHVGHDYLQSKHWVHHRISAWMTGVCCFKAARRLRVKFASINFCGVQCGVGWVLANGKATKCITVWQAGAQQMLCNSQAIALEDTSCTNYLTTRQLVKWLAAGLLVTKSGSCEAHEHLDSNNKG